MYRIAALFLVTTLAYSTAYAGGPRSARHEMTVWKKTGAGRYTMKGKNFTAERSGRFLKTVVLRSKFNRSILHIGWGGFLGLQRRVWLKTHEDYGSNATLGTKPRSYIVVGRRAITGAKLPKLRASLFHRFARQFAAPSAEADLDKVVSLLEGALVFSAPKLLATMPKEVASELANRTVVLSDSNGSYNFSFT